MGTSKHTGRRGLTGLHNKPTSCSASGAYTPGPEEKKKTMQLCKQKLYRYKIKMMMIRNE
jgi:hypothetical protein